MPAPGAFSVGLTGGIGSGKSTVADLFAARGATLIDTDRIAHRLTAPGGAAIASLAAQFGADFLDVDGAMDRAKMRSHVFADAAARRALEAILHPLIGQEVEREARIADGLYPIYVVPLLVESGRWRTRVSRILVVDCPEPLQVARVMQRSSLSAEQVKAIMATQVPRAARIAAADDLVDNSAAPALLEPQVARLHALYLRLAQPAHL